MSDVFDARGYSRGRSGSDPTGGHWAVGCVCREMAAADGVATTKGGGSLDSPATQRAGEELSYLLEHGRKGKRKREGD